MGRRSITRRLRAPSPAMVVACLSLAIALSGVGYAATMLPRNSVGSAQVKDRSLKAVDIGARELAGGAWREIEPEGTDGGAPNFENGWSNLGGDPSHSSGVFSSAAFMRDRAGFVHLKGVLVPGSFRYIFQLPVGYRPALNSIFSSATSGGSGPLPGQTYVRGVGQAGAGYVEAWGNGDAWFSLDGITFRCAPAGKHGCP